MMNNKENWIVILISEGKNFNVKFIFCFARTTDLYSIGDKKRDFVKKNRRFSLSFRRAYQ
jgi:peroxiredoxin family protein